MSGKLRFSKAQADLLGLLGIRANSLFWVSVVQPPEPADIIELDAIIDSGTQHYTILSQELENRAKKQQIAMTTEVSKRIASYSHCTMIIVK
jgi:hypothetical protein